MRGLVLKCSAGAPLTPLEQQWHGYTRLIALCEYEIEACASSISDIYSEDAAKLQRLLLGWRCRNLSTVKCF